MLVLSRCRDESFTIGKAGDVLTGPIVITVVDVRRDKARIGIACQKDVEILRDDAVKTEPTNHDSKKK